MSVCVGTHSPTPGGGVLLLLSKMDRGAKTRGTTTRGTTNMGP